MDSFELSPDNYDTSLLRGNAQQRPASDPDTELTEPHETHERQPKQKDATQQSQQEPKVAHRVKSDSPSETQVAFRNFFSDGRLRMFFGILMILIALYMLIVTISSLSHGSEDQSLIQNRTIEQIATSATSATNTGGWFGAYLSHSITHKWLGLGAFIVIFYIGAIGSTLVKFHRFNFWQLTFKSLVSAIAVSAILGLLTYNSASTIYWGGEHGYYLNHLLISNAGIWAAIGVSILLLSAVILIFLTYISKVYNAIARHVKAYKARLAERHKAAILAAEAEEQARREASQKEQTKPEENPSSDPVGNGPSSEPNTPEHLFVPTPGLTDIDTELYQNDVTNQNEESSTPTDASKISVTPTEQDTDSEEIDMEYHSRYMPAAPVMQDVPSAIDNSTTDDANDNSDCNETLEDSLEEPPMTVDANIIEEADDIANDSYAPTAELSRYRFPSIELLKVRESAGNSIDEEEQEENKNRIIRTLQAYGIEISSIKATVGPTITLYEIVPAEGVRIAKIKRLGDDMTLSLAAIGIRIIAPMPGKGTIGMEVPNKNPQTVSIRSILSSKTYQESKAALPMAMGTTISNEVYVTDLAKMPHLLVAGATGMGKSVGLNTIIASLLYKKHPAELKFVLVDPKMVEFSLYKCLERHYLAKLPEEDSAIITDPTKVVATLNSLCVEMDSRYELLSKAGMRGIKEYNEKFISRRLNPEKGHRYLPYIVVIIDEFADLIITAGKEVETPISRIAAKARAVGIHMILATQRPSVNVITGVIKANFPGRMAFRVTQMNDSRTILDRPGADQLIGRGDMLISRDGIIERVQCAFIDTDEVEAICESISEQMGYPCAYELPDYIAPTEGGGATGMRGGIADRDPLFAEAGRAIIESGTGSTSYLQRKYTIGYPRAGKIMDQLEQAGVVGAAQGGKPRAVLMDMYAFERMLEA